MDNVELTFNEASQVIEFDCPEGNPSSVTAALFHWNAGDDSTAETALDTPTVDSVDTTLDGTAGPTTSNPKNIPLTATTNIVVGRTYIVETATGQREFVEVERIVSGASAVSRVPLRVSYTSAGVDSFKGTRVTIPVLDAWSSDANNISDRTDPNPGYRCRVEYTATPVGASSSVTVVRYVYVDLVREVANHTIRPIDMESFIGGWNSVLPQFHKRDSGQQLIDEGFRWVQAQLLAHGVADNMLRNRQMLDELVKAAANIKLQESLFYTGQSNDPGRMDSAMLAFDSLFNRLVRSDNKLAQSVDTSGGASRPPNENVFSR